MVETIEQTNTENLEVTNPTEPEFDPTDEHALAYENWLADNYGGF